MRKQRVFRMASVGLVVLLLVAAGCGPTTLPEREPVTEPTVAPTAGATTEPTALAGDTPEPEPTASPTSEAKCPEMDRKPIGTDRGCQPSPVKMPFYVPNYVIVTGPEARITGFLSEIASENKLYFTPIHQLCLEYVDEVWGSACTELRFGPESLPEGAGDPNFVMRLYKVAGCPTPLDPTLGEFGSVPPELQAMVLINLQAQDVGVPIAADLSYEVGGPASGSEWQGAGSPWTYETVDSACIDPRSAFTDEWIWGTSPGINLSGPWAGDGVRVGAFDTSPWPPSVGGPGWNLEVENLPFDRLPNLFAGGTHAIPEHGAFVTGLVHAVAPRAEIRLYPVLDQYAQTDLYTLNASLDQFIRDAIRDREQGASEPIREAVINLSLGVHSPQDVISRGLVPPADWEALELPESLLNLLLTWGDERSGAPSLRMLLGAAKCHGIPTVAASGNEANADGQIPASFTDITLSVGSSTWSGTRSCFSNVATVYAPGGQGARVSEPGMFEDCQPVEGCSQASGECTFEADAQWPPLCGQVYLYGPTSSNEYVYWAGTSFSTPLVTGIVARYLEMAAAGGMPLGSEIVGEAFERVTLCAHTAPLPPVAPVFPTPVPPTPALAASGPLVSIVDAVRTLGTDSCP